MSKQNDIPQETDQAPTEKAKDPNVPEWRAKLLQAKAAGADDRTAAEFAQLSPDEFDKHLLEDPSLERQMLGARAKALLSHLKSIRRAPQWQAHEFMLEKLWPKLFSSTPDGPVSAALQALREVGKTMSPDQIDRIPELLAMAVQIDNERRALAAQAPAKPEC